VGACFVYVDEGWVVFGVEVLVEVGFGWVG